MTNKRKPADRKLAPKRQMDSDAMHQGGRCAMPAEVDDLETCDGAYKWSLYILRCSDGSLYTGITTDLTRRIDEHNGLPTESAAKRGAAYTRARRPVTLVYQEQHPDRATASKREWLVKRLSRAAKQRLVAQPPKEEG